VAHRPVLPAPFQGIRVSARVHDPDGLSAVVLKYRIDPATNLMSIAMTDDGMCDGLAGDGVYSATIPGQPDGTDRGLPRGGDRCVRAPGQRAIPQ
jgi:hypothetical protein